MEKNQNLEHNFIKRQRETFKKKSAVICLDGDKNLTPVMTLNETGACTLLIDIEKTKPRILTFDISSLWEETEKGYCLQVLNLSLYLNSVDASLIFQFQEAWYLILQQIEILNVSTPKLRKIGHYWHI